jgi:inorganic phosphate transporter, PiT family
MDLSLAAFISQMATYPSLAIIIVLVLLVTLVSGATDAPNAIATAVSTRCLSPGAALALAAVFNFLGLVGMTYVSTAVAHTMFNMVDFSGETHYALLALVAAMIASIGWGFFCWYMGIPASKSHSLIAGITGGAIAMNGWAGVVPSQWVKVIYGMVFSLVAGFLLGWVAVRVVEWLFSHVDRRRTSTVFVITQDICAAALSFLHGAQDGQKFMSIAMLGIALSFGMESSEASGFPLWLMIICSLAISLGTLIGGKRIIKSVAMDMVKLEKYQGVAASTSTVITLFVSSITGMPVSTSHCSTAAIMGVGASKNPRHVKWDVAKNMVVAWVLTFPCCGLIGFALAKLFMMFL